MDLRKYFRPVPARQSVIPKKHQTEHHRNFFRANNDENNHPDKTQNLTMPDDQKPMTYHERVLEEREALQKAANAEKFGQPTGRVSREPFFGENTTLGQRLWRRRNQDNIDFLRRRLKQKR